MHWIAAPPPPLDSESDAQVQPRYEDITQDGRPVLELMPNGIAAAVWNARLAGDPLLRAIIKSGVLPILTRFVIEGERGPFAASKAFTAKGRVAFGEVRGEDGTVLRVVLNMWTELTGPIGRTYPPQPDNVGSIAVAGRAFGEHVFTRPFAPPGERRVTRLDFEGVPSPLPRYTPRPVKTMLELPDGARSLEAPHPVEAPFVFGVMHTDSNQHVNSLVYLRLFEEAAIRRFMALGERDLLARKLEIAYRKPCFLGDRVRVQVEAFESSLGFGATCALVAEGEPEPRCLARILFEV